MISEFRKPEKGSTKWDFCNVSEMKETELDELRDSKLKYWSKTIT